MTPTKYNTYQSYAQNYKARLSLTNNKAVIHLESSNDVSIWSTVLKWALPAEEFDFIPYTKTPTGKLVDTRRIMKYFTYLSPSCLRTM